MSQYIIIGREEGNDAKRFEDKFDDLSAAATYIQERWQGIDYRDGNQGFHTDHSTYELQGFSLSDVGKVVYHSEDPYDRDFVFFNRDEKLVLDYVQAKVRVRRHDAENSTSWEQEMATLYSRGLPDPARMTEAELKAEIQAAIEQFTGGIGQMKIVVHPVRREAGWDVMLPVLAYPTPLNVGHGVTEADAIADLNAQLKRDGWEAIYLAVADTES